MATFLSKLKKINSIIKHLTAVIKSIKDLGEIVFYTFLTFYIGYDKFFKKDKTQSLMPIDVDNALPPSPPIPPESTNSSESIINEHDLLFSADLLKFFVVSVLCGINIVKIKNLLIKDKK